MTASEPLFAIRARDLRKSYGKHVVLDGIDIEVPQATIFALLGPNGAGKTTTLQILTTLLAPDSGTVEIAGHDLATDPDAVRAAIGVTGQAVAVDGFLTGEENLSLIASLRHLSTADRRARVHELLERFDLVDDAATSVATYSGGMRRRLDLAMTLIGDPKIIFLDEPTTGLDPRSRRVMWDIIRGLVASGVTIFLTTQYLEEADRLADQISVLDHGRLVATGSPEELKRLVPGGHIRLEFHDPADLTRAASVLHGAVPDQEALALQVPSDGGVTSLRTVLDTLDGASVDVAALTVRTPDLDDVFLALTAKPEQEKVAS
jgi:ABC-2 type transport system ATP-binding protein